VIVALAVYLIASVFVALKLGRIIARALGV
jgi:hypothetical protein